MHLEVRCPMCEAEPGQKCDPWPHQGRGVLARTLARREAAEAARRETFTAGLAKVRAALEAASGRASPGDQLDF
jgi:hypothetical protein